MAASLAGMDVHVIPCVMKRRGAVRLTKSAEELEQHHRPTDLGTNAMLQVTPAWIQGLRLSLDPALQSCEW